jgi:hypothetical protein
VNQSPEDRCWRACYQGCSSQVRSEYVPCATTCREQCSGCSVLAGVEKYCACLTLYGAGESHPACSERQQSVLSLSDSGTQVRARIQQVMPSLESAMYVTAHLVFSNASGRTVVVTKYKILWPGGSVILEPENLIVPALGAQERTTRINPDAGDIQALLHEPSKAHVELIDVRATR